MPARNSLAALTNGTSAHSSRPLWPNEPPKSRAIDGLPAEHGLARPTVLQSHRMNFLFPSSPPGLPLSKSLSKCGALSPYPRPAVLGARHGLTKAGVVNSATTIVTPGLFRPTIFNPCRSSRRLCIPFRSRLCLCFVFEPPLSSALLNEVHAPQLVVASYCLQSAPLSHTLDSRMSCLEYASLYKLYSSCRDELSLIIGSTLSRSPPVYMYSGCGQGFIRERSRRVNGVFNPA